MPMVGNCGSIRAAFPQSHSYSSGGITHSEVLKKCVRNGSVSDFIQVVLAGTGNEAPGVDRSSDAVWIGYVTIRGTLSPNGTA